ncbi:MAG: membrane protein insertion efficiency factor YidD [Spirosomataceae bacterium]
MPKLFISLCLILGLFLTASAQNRMQDLNYLAAIDSAPLADAPPKKSLKAVQKYNPVYWFLNGSLTVYQKVISPQFSANCLFELSCSRFSRVAIQEYGIFKGMALTADRLSRCNRISATTINPFRLNEAGKVIDIPSMYKND